MQDVTAVILCGGAGQRMGGLDKPLIEHRGRPLLEHILKELEPLCQQVLISANRNMDIYQRYAPVIADRVPDRGPLEGIACCLEHVTTPWAFVCPGDAPFVTAEIAKRLHKALDEPSAQLAVAHDGQRRQHLHLMLAVNLADAIREYLDTGQRSVYGWLQSQQAIDVAMPDIAMAFADMDEPGDLE